MTLNLAQLLRVLQRERGELEPGTKSQERPGRRVPSGDQPSVPPLGRRPLDPGPASAQRLRPATGAEKGESKRKERTGRGGGDRGGRRGRVRGKEGKLGEV